jgi:tetratricopeptide (TPR) repeat protein
VGECGRLVTKTSIGKRRVRHVFPPFLCAAKSRENHCPESPAAERSALPVGAPDFSRHSSGVRRHCKSGEIQFRCSVPLIWPGVFDQPRLASISPMPAPAIDPRARARSPAAGRRYRVFLSYSHADTVWARWLMRRLESYVVPKRFRGRAAPVGEVGRRLAPVFRDRDELPTTSDLGETIRAALRESATLVVICSPMSARSRWVQEEIMAFKRLHGERGVFAFIVGGEPKVAGAAEDCFSPALRAELGPDGEVSRSPAEVVAADARPEGDGPKLAFLRLVAGLLGVGFDELRQRELMRRNRRLTITASAALAGMALTLGLATVAWRSRDAAERRQEEAEGMLMFMLDDFRPELKKVGQLKLLDKVSTRAMDYFDALDVRDQTDTALGGQAKALNHIGQDRMTQGRYPEAARAFATAHERAAALAARNPRNADLLFERAQAEYWIGFVYWRRGVLSRAALWWTRYRDSAGALVALEGGAFRSEQELCYACHNLAVVMAEQGDLAGARREMESKLATVKRLQAVHPADRGLPLQIIEGVSMLAKIAERAGDLAEAKRCFAEKVRRLEALIDVESTADLRYQLAESAGSHAGALAVTGEWEAAHGRLARGRELLDALVAQDPANRRWLLAAQNLRLWQAVLARRVGDSAQAVTLVDEARRATETLVAAAPKDRTFVATLLFAYKTDAELTAALERPRATHQADRAVQLAEDLLRGERLNDATLSVCAGAFVVAGRVAARDGQAGAAQAHWTRAWAILQPRLADTLDWRLIDPALRAAIHLGRVTEIAEFRNRLDRIGYRPLEPWPEVESSLLTLVPTKR